MRARFRVLMLAGLAATVVSSGGCAYFDNRLNDLADCFTARAGWGLGVSVRGKLTYYLSASAGVHYCSKMLGFRGRDPIVVEKDLCLGLPLPQLYAVLMPLIGIPDGMAANWYETIGTWFSMFFTTELHNWSDERDGGTNRRKHGWKERDYELQGWLYGFNFNTLWHGRNANRPRSLPDSLFVELGVTLGVVAFDVGVNPAELLDFVLGWFGLDIWSDDEDD